MEFVPAPDHPSPPSGEIHVWCADLDAPGWPNAGGLPADERARANRFLRTEARVRWVTARWALRMVLSRYLEQEPAEIKLGRGKHGKPCLAEEPERLEFNLSHSAAIALIGVCDNRAVGADIEKIEMRGDLTELAERAMEPVDAAAVRAESGAARVSAFHERWACHEATLKCLGHGLSAPRGSAPVAVQSLQVDPGYAAAVAVTGEELPPLRCWTLGPGKT